MLIDIINGACIVQRPTRSNAFVNALIDSAELAQKAERLCPDDVALAHVHRALLELMSALARTAQLIKQEDPQ